MADQDRNIDILTVEGFGKEWSAFDQTELSGPEYDEWFAAYFDLLPFEQLAAAEGFDLGCGSGRWAAGVAPKVGLLHCIDPSAEALNVAIRRLGGLQNVQFHLASSDTIPLQDASQDFGYSLGVLHHIPDTRQALNDCVRKLKLGAPFLVYLYYALDGRPAWYRAVWHATDLARKLISRLPFVARKWIANAIAASLYWPLARSAKLIEGIGMEISNMPLASYRSRSFYSMRTDALDRFGTRLEQRFTKGEIETMMRGAGLENIRFRNAAPYWVACGTRSKDFK